jgi:hypothetical protein
MSSLNPLDHAMRSYGGRRGFGGRNRTFRSSSVRAMQVFKRGEGIAGHASPGSLDEEVVPVLGSGDGLGLGVDRWLRQARKHRFDKSIEQSVERLLAPDNADIVTGHALKPSRDQVFGFGQLGPALEFVLDCRPDERARTCVTPSFHDFIDPNPIFPTQSHGDSGSACRSRVLSHKIAPSITKRLSETQISP